MDIDEGPKYRLEHSLSNKAGCQQAACKRGGIKIAKGELRIGTNTWWESDQKYIMLWRHWGCATSHQIKGIKAIAEDNPENAPGYSQVSPESQEQVRLAFEEDRVVDKDWKDVREDLAKQTPPYGGEIRHATGYKVEVTGRGTAICRNPTCRAQGIKIAKGELRLGIATMFTEDYETWQFKHWKCISRYDINAAKEYLGRESLDGINHLPEEYKKVVLESFNSGKAIEPPKLVSDRVTKPKRVPRKKAEADDDEDLGAAKSQSISRKKRVLDKVDASEVEEDTSKKRGRASKKISST